MHLLNSLILNHHVICYLGRPGHPGGCVETVGRLAHHLLKHRLAHHILWLVT